MQNLFENANQFKNAPLAFRMSPKKLEDFVGQEHIVGEGKLLRRAIEADRITSIIFFGPPGVGKTALAKIIAQNTQANFISLNCTVAKIEDIRKVVKTAEENKNLHGQRTILFLDEIHRFNKTQQDALLPDVESGTIILIGSTTENPFFYVNSALVSRSQVFQFKPLSEENIKTILRNALKDKERGLGNFKVELKEDALQHLVQKSDGDARKALSALEVGVLTTKPKKDEIIFDLEVAEESIQKKAVVYDKQGEEHYNTISAFIKSMRGSDPDAAVYYLAKMIYAGEDPRFIARRIVICAAEDVGNADPLALVVANACHQAAEFIGLPEARIPLAQAAIYVACAPKSNASYVAIDAALKDVENEKTQEIPNHLKNAPAKGMKDLGYGKGYKYAHNSESGYIKQDYMQNKKNYYEPKDIGFESKIKKRLETL